MEPTKEKFTSPASLLVDAILVVGFFLYMTKVIASHVPSHDPRMIWFWSAAAASCMAAVFWLAVQMFRVVYRAQRLAAKS
jgi:uncharacterized membrane-anchored protein